MKKTEHQSVRQGEATFTLQRDGILFFPFRILRSIQNDPLSLSY